ncbi:MAG TPA: carbonic anhydrase [Rhizomicrobium sp.]|nr:carbonic anhydrase [Rhizomicrobium sp.]
MCPDAHPHPRPTISRRHFGLVAGAFALVPFASARASGDVDALALTCIDYRLVGSGVQLLDSLGLTKDFDQVALAGASLAATSDKFPSANAAFWDQLDIARQLHHVRRLVVVDHRDCGAYKVVFGKDFASNAPAEDAQHLAVMQKVKAELAQKHPELTSEYYLMALDGTAKKLL